MKISSILQLIAASGAVLTTLGTFLLPADAAILNFDFTTLTKSGSFKLDTATVDSDLDPNQGFFEDAISDFFFDGNLISASEDLRTEQAEDPDNGEFFTLFRFGPIIIDSPIDDNRLGLTDLNLINTLSASPSDYTLRLSTFGTLEFGGLIVRPPGEVPDPEFTDLNDPPRFDSFFVQGLAVSQDGDGGDPTRIPEPSSPISLLLVIVAGGIGSLLKKG